MAKMFCRSTSESSLSYGLMQASMYLVEVVLQPLVGKVNANLLKPIGFKVLKAEDVCGR